MQVSLVSRRLLAGAVLSAGLALIPATSANAADQIAFQCGFNGDL